MNLVFSREPSMYFLTNLCSRCRKQVFFFIIGYVLGVLGIIVCNPNNDHDSDNVYCSND